MVRFEPSEGLHLHARPVPEGTGLDLELPVFARRFDVVAPLYPDGRIASETRPLDRASAVSDGTVGYQACDDEQCRLPKTEKLALDVIDVPNIRVHVGHGQREGAYDGMPHVRRMLLRALRRSPMGFLRFVAKNVRLELAARRRRRR